MKVGNYVRTEYGISKIIGIYPQKTLVFIETDNGLGNCNCIEKGKLRKGIAVLEEDYRNFIDNNVKEKPIDLIEAGDYINGNKVDAVGKRYLIFYDGDGDIELYDNDIKSIVTKEQFENMEYRIGE